MAGQLSLSAGYRPERTGILKAIAAISTVAGWCSAAMIVAAVAITCQMIFIRFVLNGSTVWQTEAVIYLIVAATLVGLPFVQSLRGHVNVDLIAMALPPKARRALTASTMALSAAIVAVMTWYGFEYWYLTYSRGWTSDTVWAVRLWIPYAALPIGFGLLFLQMIADFASVLLDEEAADKKGEV